MKYLRYPTNAFKKCYAFTIVAFYKYSHFIKITKLKNLTTNFLCRVVFLSSIRIILWKNFVYERTFFRYSSGRKENSYKDLIWYSKSVFVHWFFMSETYWRNSTYLKHVCSNIFSCNAKKKSLKITDVCVGWLYKFGS